MTFDELRQLLEDQESRPLWTQAEVVERLPQWMQGEFDCPDRGPHDWRPVSAGFYVLWMCTACPRRRKVSACPDTRDPLEVIAGLQFSR